MPVWRRIKPCSRAGPAVYRPVLALPEAHLQGDLGTPSRRAAGVDEFVLRFPGDGGAALLLAMIIGRWVVAFRSAYLAARKRGGWVEHRRGLRLPPSEKNLHPVFLLGLVNKKILAVKLGFFPSYWRLDTGINAPS
ncbi:hypothetical protein GCM10023238_14950 [Streptomyces heliomycini]